MIRFPKMFVFAVLTVFLALPAASIFAVSDYGKLLFGGIENAPFACAHGMDKAFPLSPGATHEMSLKR